MRLRRQRPLADGAEKRDRCAAAPALVYADTIIRLAGAYPDVAAYLARLKKRPSFERALVEAEPCWELFPRE